MSRIEKMHFTELYKTMNNYTFIIPLTFVINIFICFYYINFIYFAFLT